MSALLTVDGVDKSFGGLRAVGGVSFKVPKGSIFGLIGPNGAGKTTVFNLITGVYRADKGSISLRALGVSGGKQGLPPDVGGVSGGKQGLPPDVGGVSGGKQGLPPDVGGVSGGKPGLPSDGIELVGKAPAEIAAQGIARTFQNIRLFHSMTVLDNVLVAGELKRRANLVQEIMRTRHFWEDERALEDRARTLLSAMGLSELADHAATSLPYGSQRRLEIARALMLQPKLLLLDEPAAGLNYGEAESLKEQIRKLRDTYDLTIILVEHNMQVVMGVCERIHVLDHGETIAEGTPDEVKRHPKVIAAYLGEEREEAEA